MARAQALSPGRAITVRSGPWTGVEDTSDPFDATQNVLVQARNRRLAGPTEPVGIYARNGWRLVNNGVPLAATGRGQATYPHPMVDGTTINFYVANGRLFRPNATRTIATDVTPSGITIDAGARVFFASLVGELFATDGVNRPWIGTDLLATPITGTYIDYDGAGVEWTTFGNPVQNKGAIFAALNQVGGVSRRTDISWCNAGTLSTGWQQPNYDKNWTLIQNSSGAINALAASETDLKYFRDHSIGSASGDTVDDLRSTATEDAIAFNVGTQSATLIQKYGNTIFFGDSIGRPYSLQPGSPPKDIWQQCRTVVNNASTGFPDTTRAVATSAFETNANLYLCAPWSPTPSTQAPPTEMMVFDGETGIYEGQWDIAADANGGKVAIEAMGSIVDASGRNIVTVIGSLTAAPSAGCYVWEYCGFSADTNVLTTTDGRILTTTDGRWLTTGGTAENWKDNGVIPDRRIVTDRLAYDEDMVMNGDLCTVIATDPGPYEVTVGTTNSSGTVQGTGTPSPSQDGTYRIVVGTEFQGRGPEVTIRPTTADVQSILQRVTLRLIPSKAGPEDA